MQQPVTRRQALRLVGKKVIATKKDGRTVVGKLMKVSGNRLIIQRNTGKRVQTKAIIPLVLFDLLAIGTAPYAFGGYGYPPYGGGYGQGPKQVGGGYGPGGYGPGGFGGAPFFF